MKKTKIWKWPKTYNPTREKQFNPIQSQIIVMALETSPNDSKRPIYFETKQQLLLSIFFYYKHK